MSTAIPDNSTFGTSNIKTIYTSMIKASKVDALNTFANLKFFAYNGTSAKNVGMELSVFNDTPSLTFYPNGVAATGVVISGVARPQDPTDAANKTYIDEHTSATTTHGVTGNIVGTEGVQNLDSKTLTNAIITAASNSVTADTLRFSNGLVTVNTGPSPNAKDILMATGPGEARWDKVPYLPLEIQTTNITTSAGITAATDADPYTRIRHYILSPPGTITYTLANTTNNMLPNMEIFLTLISTGNCVIQGDTNVHLYAPGYTGVPGGSYNLNIRGATIQLKKRNDTEWVLMVM